MTKKKIKTPLPLRIVAWLFPRVETLFPSLAQRWFVKIFFTPVRYKFPPPELELIDQADKSTIQFENKKIQVYAWGEGKPILFVHGWMGRAAQCRKLIPVLNQAGYKVVAFDSTGHGKSEGKKSNLMEFARIIDRLKEKYDFDTIVSHSLGGIASLHAIIDTQVANRLVMISSPAIADQIVGEFLNRINGSKKSTDYFYRYVKQEYGKEFEEFSGRYIIDKLRNVDLLLIHDEEDPEVSMDSPLVIKSRYPEAELVITKGLGHTRILKDEVVIEKISDFATKKQKSYA